MEKIAHQIYSFDEFTLDLTRGCLFRQSEELKLRPKSFEVLKFLIENNGRLISKDEIIENVWQEMAVTDDSLVQCLKDIRLALSDKSQTFIKTVPRRGYIFEKEVRENGTAIYTEETAGVHLVIEETLDDEKQKNEIAALRQKSKVASLVDAIKRHKIAATIVSAVLIGITIAGMIFYRPVLMWWFKPPSIAVLPIVNATGGAGEDYVSDGMTESIITSLTQLNEGGKNLRVRVIAQTTVFIFKGKEIDARMAGRELGADTVLAGKMLRQAGLRIFKFEMINVADGSIVWSKQYSSAFGDTVLEAQDKIPSDVAAQLPIKLSEADRENLTRRYTQNAKAYDLFLKGRAEFRKVTPSGLSNGIELFQKATDLDPDFALAYWAMGVSFKSQGNIDERSDKEADEKSLELFRKALSIDNNLTVAETAIKQAEAKDWDWKAIEEAGPTHPGYERYLMAMGRLDEVLEIQKRRLQNNPYAPFLNFTHCNTYLALRRPDDAIAQCKKTLNIVPAADKAYFGPESPWIHLYLGLAYGQKEMYPEAIAEMKTAVELGENSKTLLAELGALYAKSGQKDEAMKILAHLKERENAGEYAPSINIAKVYAVLGDTDQAIFWLTRAVDERENRAISMKRSDTYDSLRDDPRFAELLRRMNLPPQG